MPDDPKPSAAQIEAALPDEMELASIVDTVARNLNLRGETHAARVLLHLHATIATLLAERDEAIGNAKHALHQAEQLTARAEAAEHNFQAEYDIVNRIWEMLGFPSYGQLNGRSIYDLIQEKIDRAAHVAGLEEEIRRKDAALRVVHQDLLDRAENGQVAIGNSAWAALANAIIAQPKEPS